MTFALSIRISGLRVALQFVGVRPEAAPGV